MDFPPPLGHKFTTAELIADCWETVRCLHEVRRKMAEAHSQQRELIAVVRHKLTRESWPRYGSVAQKFL